MLQRAGLFLSDLKGEVPDQGRIVFPADEKDVIVVGSWNDVECLGFAGGVEKLPAQPKGDDGVVRSV